MSYVQTDEQADLRAATRDLLAARAGREARRAYVDDGKPYDAELWKLMAGELGLHGVAIDERYGGAGGTLSDLSVVLEETGAALLCAPFLATVVLAATAIDRSGDEAVKSELLPGIANGDTVATLVYRGPMTARGGADGWSVSGTAEHVIDGGGARTLLVIARTENGQGLFVVDADADGVDRTDTPTLDPTRRLARLQLSSAAARLVGNDGDGAVILSDTLDIARVALSAEQAGGAQRCLDMSVEYVKTRNQFGRPIGSFQAIKHHVANMFVAVQVARAASLEAAWTATEDPDAFRTAMLATSSLVSEAYLRTAKLTLQVHGGIGYTWEHEAHLYLKRAMTSARLFGAPTEHREALVAALGL
jgi:alkylation response protein AidB-like acyl-CoA dehydrogenase